MTHGTANGREPTDTRIGRPDDDLLGVQIAEDLTRYISREGLAVGDALPSEASLADHYGVSQRAVRDAFRLLTQHGIVQTRKGKRAMVSDLQPVAVQGYFKLATGMDEDAPGELLELRQVLETRAAGLAAGRIEKTELTELDGLLGRAERTDLEVGERVELDLAFHQAIVRSSGNRFFVAIHQSLGDVLASERRRGTVLTESVGGRHQDSDAEHREILRALVARDAESAEQAMRTHLDHVAGRFDRLAE